MMCQESSPFGVLIMEVGLWAGISVIARIFRLETFVV